MKYKMELSEKQYALMLEALNFYIRMGIGQWEQLNNLITHVSSEWENWVDNPYQVRDNATDFYSKNGLSKGGSFGIHSPELNEDIRTIYDMYKVMMYEHGAGGVYGSKPSPIAKDNESPIVVSSDDEKFIRYTGENLEDFRKCIGDENFRPELVYSDGTKEAGPWIKNGEYAWRKLEKGLSARVKHNGAIELLKISDNGVVENL